MIKPTRLWRLCVVAAMVAGILAPASVIANDYLQRARAMQLADAPGWLALLHYRHAVFSGEFRSQADDAAFFLSPVGATDARAELEAALHAFLQPAAANHAQCRFPARWHWLKQQLAIPAGHDVPCPKLERWLQQFPTTQLSLVFPVMYLDNPASSFGHTFLRFDSDNVLLSQALNYAAAVDAEDNFLLYTYNGLFGGYRGVFKMRHYFETVQQYNDIENRDIWEYRLDYSADEIRQLARHVWEVSAIRFDYYFFRENCSYRLLTLLDVIRPALQLASDDNFPVFAIPVDTVRALASNGLIRQRNYRPSQASVLTQEFTRQAEAVRESALQLAASTTAVEQLAAQSGDETAQATALELAYDLLQFRGEANTLRAEQVLRARSRLPSVQAPKVEAPQHAPETGHASSRLALAAGESNRDSYVELQYRAAFHDLVDAPRGYVNGAQISILDSRIRWSAASESLVLQQLDIIDVLSLSPLREWHRPLSWQAAARLQRERRDSQDADMVFSLRGGGGASLDLGGSLLFAMLFGETRVSRDYEGDYSLLAGPQLGLLARLGTVAQGLLQVELGEPVSGFELERDRLSFEMQFNLAANTALRAGYALVRYEGFDDSDWHVSWQRSF